MTTKQVQIAFLSLCGVVFVSLATLVGTGHDGAITSSLLGIAAGIFGANFWVLLKG